MSDTAPPTPPPIAPKSRRGFASMDPAAHRALCAKGGRAAHAAGKAHEFTSETGRAAGRLGGIAVHEKKLAARKAQGEKS